ncbi:hypothetical protein QQS21_011855 [Conoideocrella luteorostrata]|uniref:Up-regulated in Daf-2 domain-containing protein n=1 Tax=Conoideocrella luteorostrata TaxID=1105319 RepID=A0AAJ0CCB1_9HYPO|nr:hypothetical protein QQS21_011855 [Conoideocrella luteorostrata]
MYRDVHHWDVIQPGNTTAPEDMKVHYETGLTTTGKNWWMVYWLNEEHDTMYLSNPNNFRKYFDFVDEHTLGVSGAIALAAFGIIAFGVLGPEIIACAVLNAVICEESYFSYSAAIWSANLVIGGIVVEGAALSTLFLVGNENINKEKTEGFKQHILRTDNETNCTRIIINEDQTIDFKSESGDSSTIFSSILYNSTQAKKVRDKVDASLRARASSD